MSMLKWLTEAKKFLGLKETKGQANTPEIVQFWKDIKRGGIKDDETPWCAAFVGAMLERVGIVSSRFEGAKSYLTWGDPLPHPIEGCIVVFSREGGGHVGFVVGLDAAGNLQVLGGNQGDMVCIKSFPMSRADGLRWPSGEPKPTTPMPIYKNGAPISTKES